MVHNGIIHVAAHVEGSQSGSLQADCINQLPAADLRHNHIGHHHIDRVEVLMTHLNRRLTVARFQNFEPARLEGNSGNLPHSIFIFDEQDCFHSGCGRVSCTVGRLLGGFASHREDHSKCRPGANDTVDKNMSTALFHNAMSHSQPESGSFADRLGRKKGIKNLGQDVGRNSMSGIGDGQFHIRSLCRTSIDRHLRFSDKDQLCGYPQSTTSGHRIAGVDDQVHNDLFNLSGIGLDASIGAGRFDGQQNVFTDDATQQGCRIRDQAAEIQNPRFNNGSTTKRQQLLRQSGGSLTRFTNGRDGFSIRVAIRHGRKQQVTVAADHRQQVIEVVSDTTSQPPDGFHFLRFMKLVFEALFVGNVTHDTGVVSFSFQLKLGHGQQHGEF